MHKRSPDIYEYGVDRGSKNKERGDGSFCKCGCGTYLEKDKYGRKRRFVLGHQINKRSNSEWKKRFEEYMSKSPECKCGCGSKVRPTYNKIESFIHSRGAIRYPKYIKGHDKQPIYNQYNFIPTEEEIQAIMGTCLGDSSLILPNKRSRNYRLCATHGLVQKEWVKHKSSIINRFGVSIKNIVNGGYGDYSTRMWTRCLPCLTKIANTIYNGRRKQISKEWLNSIGDIGLAWWFCDDGSNSGNRMSFTLHTEGFNKKDNEIIKRWFDKQGLNCLVSINRKYYYILFNVKSSLKIKNIIQPYVPKCMQYKLEDRSEYLRG